jgi:hypothetical protein
LPGLTVLECFICGQPSSARERVTAQANHSCKVRARVDSCSARAKCLRWKKCLRELRRGSRLGEEWRSGR